MNSSYIKAVLTANYRFSKQTHIMATEVGRYNADFLAIKNDKLIEIEIKTSKADLNADFKKPKHRIYESGNSYWTPNEFYFAVPEGLVEYAVSKCIGKKYGVISISENGGVKRSKFSSNSHEGAEKRAVGMIKRYPEFSLVEIKEDKRGGFSAILEREEYFPWKDRVRIVKRAKKLHTRIPNEKVTSTIIARLSSEMANLRASEFSLKESLNGKKTSSTIQNCDS